MRKFKLFIPALAISILISSCALKTISVGEHGFFTPTKYNLRQDSIDIAETELSIATKDSLLDINKIIVNTEFQSIAKWNSVAVSRDFIKINDSINAECFCYTPDKYKQTIVIMIGNKTRQTSWLTYLSQLAKETQSKVYTWNYRGYGKSNGHSSFKTQYNDNQYIYDQLHCQEENMNCIVIGYSLGSVFASSLGVENHADRLVLLAPASDFKDVLKFSKHQFLAGFKIIFRPFIKLVPKYDYIKNINNTDKIKTYKNDLLIVSAKDDNTLSHSMSKKLYAASPSSNKKLISPKTGDHGAPTETENWNKLIQWLNSVY